ncbi:MAG TPA: endolytic transglycosylase MltG [Gaiellaceae bacterium]|nr:endolytic transglycosylase MltG [Gaiellaceae bacterium]
MRSALVVAAALLAVTAAGCGGSGGASQPTTTIRQLRQFRVVFPEGFTRRQMADRVDVVAKIAERESHRKVKLSRAAYLAATAKPRLIPGFGKKKLPLEGFLFPDTYDFDRKSTSAQLVQLQLREFTAKWKTLDLSYARSKNLTPYDVLTIASMIEKEAVAPGDRAKVARVIYNRLHLGMTLGIDATIRYALNIPGTKSLTQSDLANPTPYNTRLHAGLPPTPIASPGLASMQAAAHPANGPWLYFVAEPDKVHSFFTASAEAFNQYKATHGYG